MVMDKPNVLFLADTAHHTGAVQDHINAIVSNARINWHVINPLICKTVDKLDFSLFDAIGIHYSIKPYNHYYLSAALKNKIADYQKFKFLFLQDEYQRVNQVQEYLYALKFNVLFTLVNPQLVDIAYPDYRLKNLKKVTVLTGYVQDTMKGLISSEIAQREIDVSYRGRRCEFWLGSLAYEKQYIAEQFIKKTADKNLVLDVSLEESDRVYGDAWFKLLNNSKAVLGTESGASIWDFDRSIEKKTNHYLGKNKQADFHEVYEHILKSQDGTILYNAISPRVFEAAATKTPMIMFPGDYSGVCIPEKHYIVLEKDFSNIDDVISKVKNTNYLQDLADRTYRDLIESDLYSQHRLSEIVAVEILNQMSKPAYSSGKDVASHLGATHEKYKTINEVRRITTEFSFLSTNLFQILFDKKYSFLVKFKMMFKGMKRYIVYLAPRLKRRAMTDIND